jgi:hypothetical protein
MLPIRVATDLNEILICIGRLIRVCALKERDRIELVGLAEGPKQSEHTASDGSVAGLRQLIRPR